jgi:ferrous iron transport protein B
VYFKGISTPFIMELPPYRFPTLKNLAIHTWLKFRHFVVKAGTFILLINLIIWMALNLPWKPDKPEDSILGKVGHFLAPLFSPLGFGDWAASASLLTGFTAKEVIVSAMAQIYVTEKEEDKEDKKDLSLKEDLIKLKDLFADKTKEAVLNLTSTFGIASLTVELPEDGKGLCVVMLSLHGLRGNREGRKWFLKACPPNNGDHPHDCIHRFFYCIPTY